MLPHAIPFASCWKSSCTWGLGYRRGGLGLDRRDVLVRSVLDPEEHGGLDRVPRSVEGDPPRHAREVLRRRDHVAELGAGRLLLVAPRPAQGLEPGRILLAKPLERAREHARGVIAERGEAVRGGVVARARSEERRVGKECRSRGSPGHGKKKARER